MPDPLPTNPDDPTPPPKPILPYRATQDETPYQPITPLGLQVLAGFIAWVLGVGCLLFAANTPGLQHIIPIPGFGLIGGLLTTIGGLAIWLRIRFRWRGFIPGLLIGFLLTCLIPVGIVAVICFGGGGNGIH